MPRPWPIKAARKRSGSQGMGGGFHSSDRDSPVYDSDDKEEAEFLSNVVEEVTPPDHIACFFCSEDYQSILCKCMLPLDLKDAGGTTTTI